MLFNSFLSTCFRNKAQLTVQQSHTTDPLIDAQQATRILPTNSPHSSYIELVEQEDNRESRAVENNSQQCNVECGTARETKHETNERKPKEGAKSEDKHGYENVMDLPVNSVAPSQYIDMTRPKECTMPVNCGYVSPDPRSSEDRTSSYEEVPIEVTRSIGENRKDTPNYENTRSYCPGAERH